MAKTQRKYLVGTLICSLVSIAILIVSFATEDWVRADPEIVGTPSAPLSHVNYGLFFGTLERSYVVGTSTELYRLSIACVFSDNVCAYSCLSNPEDRTGEVEKLYERGNAPFNCTPQSHDKYYNQRPFGQYAEGTQHDSSRFVNAGMWISTIIFLASSLLFSTLGCGFTIYNIFSNPLELYASIYGLYIWFTIAAVSDFMVLILWGCEFSIRISSNIAILDTIVSYLKSDGNASLQYSYFIVIVAEVMHIFCIGFLYYRDRVLNKESKQKTIAVDSKADDNGLIY